MFYQIFTILYPLRYINTIRFILKNIKNKGNNFTFIGFKEKEIIYSTLFSIFRTLIKLFDYEKTYASFLFAVIFLSS